MALTTSRLYSQPTLDISCCADWNSGHDDGVASSPGSNGRQAGGAAPNSQTEEHPLPSPPRRQDQAWGRGVSADRYPFISRSTTPPSPNWDSLTSSNPSRPLKPPNRRVRTRTHGGVGGGTPRGAPYPDYVSVSVNGAFLILTMTSLLTPSAGLNRKPSRLPGWRPRVAPAAPSRSRPARSA